MKFFWDFPLASQFSIKVVQWLRMRSMISADTLRNVFLCDVEWPKNFILQSIQKSSLRRGLTVEEEELLLKNWLRTSY